MFGLDLLLGTKGRFYKQEGCASSAFSILTKNVVFIGRRLSVVNLIMQPCFGYGFYVGLVSLNGHAFSSKIVKLASTSLLTWTSFLKFRLENHRPICGPIGIFFRTYDRLQLQSPQPFNFQINGSPSGGITKLCSALVLQTYSPGTRAFTSTN